jgi:uncharacterized protein (TIGR02246 family)
VIGAVLTGAGCRSSAPALTPAARDAIADTVRALARDFIAADHAKAPDQVIALFDESPDVTIASNGALRESRQSFHEALVTLYAATRTLDILPDTARVTVLSPDAAVVTESYHYTRTGMDGKGSGGIAVITYVCQRREGRWKIIHYHFSQKPSENR